MGYLEDLTSIEFALQMTSKNIELNGRGKQSMCISNCVLEQHVKNPLLDTEKKRENDWMPLDSDT
jgi:hypothetical protein